MQNTKATIFGDKSVIGMKFPDYLDWAAAGSDGSIHFLERLCLPSIQRGFIWKPAQIVNLWDSLFRGLPIGSLLINHLGETEYVTSTDAKDRRTVIAGLGALGLLDGQQRTLAMLLGWPKGKDSDKCIWIDLAENGKSGAPFELRITTKSQPFGFQRHTHQKFPVFQRRDARETRAKELGWPKEENIPDSEICNSLDRTLRTIRPWKGVNGADKLLVPLRDLWAAYLQKSYDKDSWFKSELLSLALEAENTQVRKRLDMLYSTFERLEQAEIPLVLLQPQLPAPEHPTDEPGEDPLILLFERISTGGTRLSPGDLLFSMLKHKWPQAHDLVENIHTSKVKHLLSATDLVLTAFRLAVIESQEKQGKEIIVDHPDPGPSDFHRHLRESEDAYAILKSFLETDRLKHAFDTFYDLVVYKNNGTSDKGIPELMMPFLQRPLIQVLVFWVLRRLTAGTIRGDIESSRSDIIAFILQWNLCVIGASSANRASQECIKIIIDTPFMDFPAKALYHELTTTEGGRVPAMRTLPSPEDVSNALNIAESHLLRSFAERFRFDQEAFQSKYRDVLEHFWWKRDLLLWIQREYLTTKFPLYDALAGKEDEDTVPYDYDHLCPQDEWRVDFRVLQSASQEAALSEECKARLRDLWRRDHTGHSIGNIHVLSAHDNRSANNANFIQKVGGLIEKGDWRYEDSAIPECDKGLWEKTASVTANRHYWSDQRVRAFQLAVDRRFLYLYSLYYKAIRDIVE